MNYYDSFLEETFERLKQVDKRRAAEIAYVLAVLMFEERDVERATNYGRESIKLFEELNIQTLDQAAARYVVLNGVALPDYIHEWVVRDRLKMLGLPF
jgi:hypothetical protein